MQIYINKHETKYWQHMNVLHKTQFGNYFEKIPCSHDQLILIPKKIEHNKPKRILKTIKYLFLTFDSLSRLYAQQP